MASVNLNSNEEYVRISNLLKTRNYDEWLIVSQDYHFLVKADNMLKNPDLSTLEATTIRSFLSLMNCFKEFLTFKEIIINPIKYSDRANFIAKFRNKTAYEVNFLYTILPNDDVELLNFVNDVKMREDQNTFVLNDKEKYNNLLTFIKNIDAVNEDNIKDISLYLHDILGINPDDLYILFSYYLNSLTTGLNEFILEDYNINNIIALKKIYQSYLEYYNKANKTGSEDIFDKDILAKLNSLLIDIDEYLSSDNNPYYLVELLIDKYNYSLKDIKKLYNSYILLSKHYNDNISGNAILDSIKSKLNNKVNYDEIFNKIMEIYHLLSTSVYFIDMICSSLPDRDRIIKLSFKAKYIHKVIPSHVKITFLKRSNYVNNKGKDGIAKVEKYTEDYKEYYYDRKEKDSNETKELNERNNINVYAKYIEDYLTYSPDNLASYLKRTNISEIDFNGALEILKREHHPIYDQYVKFTNATVDDISIKVGNIIARIRDNSDSEETPFDILDFYASITMNKNDFLNYVRKNRDEDDYRICLKFFNKYKSDSLLGPISLDSLMTKSASFILSQDENGNPLVKYDATEEDKKRVVEILTEKKIPITRYTYEIMLKRYVFARYESSTPDNNEIGKQKIINV